MSEKKLSERLREFADAIDWRNYTRIEEVKAFANEVEALECLLAKEIEYAKGRERKIAGLRRRLT